jgi:hypothetical protein
MHGTLVALGIVLTACGQPASPSTSTTPGALLVPSYAAQPTTATFLCGAGRFIPSVVGTLSGNVSDPTFVWLSSPSGQRFDVLWPPGFAVLFEPRLTLLDASGAAVAHGGDRIDINTHPARHAGTASDPYLASQFNEGCYAPPVTP